VLYHHQGLSIRKFVGFIHHDITITMMKSMVMASCSTQTPSDRKTKLSAWLRKRSISLVWRYSNEFEQKEQRIQSYDEL